MTVLMDCDAGYDDALALQLLCRSGIDLLGVSTCFGGFPPQHAAMQAAEVLKSEGKSVPVCSGAQAALVRKQGAVHRDAPAPWQGMALAAGAFLTQCLQAAKAPVTLLATAPLTNVAAMLKQSAVWPAHIVIMGGGIAGGNRTRAAEFNFWCDPEAANEVLQSGCPITLLPLEAARDCLLTEAVAADLSPASKALVERHLAFSKRTGCGDGQSTIAYDAVAAAGLLDASVFASSRQCTCRVDCTDTDTAGALCSSDAPGSVSLVESVNARRFAHVLHAHLGALRDTKF